MATIHQSDLSSYARCPELFRLERSGTPRRQMSITAYGTLTHHCFGGETQFWTRNGIKRLDECVGQSIQVLARRTIGGANWVDAEVRDFGIQPLWRITLSSNRYGRREIYATAEHRWFKRSRTDRTSELIEVETRDLKVGDGLGWQFPRHSVRSGSLSPMGVAHGIVHGDGTRESTECRLDLYGEKHELRAWFSSEHPVSEHPEMQRMSIRAIPLHLKDLPSLNMDSPYLLGFLAGYFATDGCVTKDGALSISSIDRSSIDFFRTAAARCGIATTAPTQTVCTTGYKPGSISWETRLISQTVPDWFLFRRKHVDRFRGAERSYRGWKVASIEPNVRLDRVYCAVVPEAGNFVLADWILTGNCTLNIFEQQWRTGTSWDEALDAAIESFVHFWHPANIAEVTEPVDLWLPMQTWASLNERGPTAIRWYAEWSRDIGDQLLATEYSFQIPIPGTWDPELNEPHILAGTIDRLAFEYYKMHPVLKVSDLKSGKVGTYLRQRLQFSAYGLATTLPEFWVGWRGEEGFGEERGRELHERYGKAFRRAEWVGLRDLEVKDAGWRGPDDYERFARAVNQFVTATKLNVYPLNIDGTTCRFCDMRDSCAGVGVPTDEHGGPSGR